MKIARFLKYISSIGFALLALGLLAKPCAADAARSIVNFSGEDGASLQGYYYKPAGAGPFPAVLYNHGSETNVSGFPQLGKYFTDHGFVFFVPCRRGQGLSASAGTSIREQGQALHQSGLKGKQIAAQMIGLHEAANHDVLAGLKWLKAQPEVNAKEIVVSGVSYGGIQTLLTAEQDAKQSLHVKAFVAFAPAAMSWNPTLGERLGKAIKSAKAPIFVIQAENDYNLGPSQYFDPILVAKGGLNRGKIYPAFGTNHQEGHGKFAATEPGTEIWGADVLGFLKECGVI